MTQSEETAKISCTESVSWNWISAHLGFLAVQPCDPSATRLVVDHWQPDQIMDAVVHRLAGLFLAAGRRLIRRGYPQESDVLRRTLELNARGSRVR